MTDKRLDLIRWSEQQIGKPFEWGQTDCTTLTLEGIKIYYGKEIPITLQWRSFKDALRAYKEYGNPADILEVHGFVEIRKNYEQTGDIFLWQGKGYWLLGMVVNGSVLIADEGRRIEMKPVYAFTEDYRVFGVR